MNWLEFIFSSRARYRLMRHGIFWLAWWWYFYSFSFLLKSPSNTSGLLENPLWIWKLHELLLSFYLVLIQMITVYTITHYLLPRLLEDHRTFKFIFSVAILALLMTVSCHVVYQYFYPQGADYNIPFNSRNRTTGGPVSMRVP